MKTLRRPSRGVTSGPVTLLAAVLLVTVFLAAAVPRLIDTFETRALQRALTATPALNRTVSATDGWVVSTGNGPRADQLRQSLMTMGSQLPRPLVSPAAARWAGVATPFVPVLHAARSAKAAGDQPLLEIVYREPLTRHLRMISGELPDRYSRSDAAGRPLLALDAAVTQATAARFSLHVGSDIQLGDIVLRVVGIARPTDPAAAFWTYDQTFFGPKL
jgi:putative ABC transport system permease protein